VEVYLARYGSRATFDNSSYDDRRKESLPPIFTAVDPFDPDPSYRPVFSEDLPRKVKEFLKAKPFRIVYNPSKQLEVV